MRPARLFLLPVLVLAGLSACGPAPSDNTPTLDLRPSPAPLASESKTDPVPTKETIPVGDRPKATPDLTTKKSVNPMDTLEVPAWFAKDLASPDIDTRLRALDTWVLTTSGGSIDPLILAFEKNDDDRVRARAMELIEQDWARTAEAGQ